MIKNIHNFKYYLNLNCINQVYYLNLSYYYNLLKNYFIHPLKYNYF